VPVHRRPKVAVLATGDELVMPGTTPAAGEIVYSNGFATIALAEREGCEIVDLGIAPTGCRRPWRPSAAPVPLVPISWSPRVALRLGTMTWCSRRSRVKAGAVNFGESPCARAGPMLHGSLGAMHVLGLRAIRSRPTSAPSSSWCR